MLYQHLCAANDPSGNPQRVYLVYDEKTGNVIQVHDEGYQGPPDCVSGMVELPTIQIPRSEYHMWIRLGRKIGKGE